MLCLLVIKLLYLKRWVKNNCYVVSSYIISLNIILLILLLSSLYIGGQVVKTLHLSLLL